MMTINKCFCPGLSYKSGPSVCELKHDFHLTYNDNDNKHDNDDINNGCDSSIGSYRNGRPCRK